LPTLKAFWKEDCPRCPQMKQVVEQLRKNGYKVQYFDIETVDGLAEGAFHSVLSTPTLLLVDDKDRELAQWRGIIPTMEEVKQESAIV
jgi:thiol-disulfide isomerase/thioredoxin